MLKAIIVVPCYNEAERLNLQVFGKNLAQSPWLGFLFVNDGSHDQTLPLLTNFAEDHPYQVGVLSDDVNRGKASAVRRGLSVAIKHRPQYVGFWDADLATPLSEIGGFCEVLDDREDIAVVIGTRISLLGHQIQRKTTRRILGRLFATAASRVLSIPMRDTQCGAKLFRVDSKIDSVFESPFCSKWILDVEIFARMIVNQKQGEGRPVAETIYERPLENWYEVPGSKLKSRDFAKAVYELGMIYWKYLGPFRRTVLTQKNESSLLPNGLRVIVPLQQVEIKQRSAA